MSQSGKSFAVWMGLSFLAGILIGYKLKGLRIKYLQAKRNYLQKKVAEVQKKIDYEAVGFGDGLDQNISKSTLAKSTRPNSRGVAGVVITA